MKRFVMFTKCTEQQLHSELFPYNMKKKIGLALVTVFRISGSMPLMTCEGFCRMNFERHGIISSITRKSLCFFRSSLEINTEQIFFLAFSRLATPNLPRACSRVSTPQASQLVINW
jgi:hypothetical protein